MEKIKMLLLMIWKDIPFLVTPLPRGFPSYTQVVECNFLRSTMSGFSHPVGAVAIAGDAGGLSPPVGVGPLPPGG
jgi:hypothetical protein